MEASCQFVCVLGRHKGDLSQTLYLSNLVAEHKHVFWDSYQFENFDVSKGLNPQ